LNCIYREDFPPTHSLVKKCSSSGPLPYTKKKFLIRYKSVLLKLSIYTYITHVSVFHAFVQTIYSYCVVC
jgi:hypothetical protein